MNLQSRTKERKYNNEKNITRGITCYNYNFGVVSGTQIKNVCTMESYNKLGERELKRRCKDLGENVIMYSCIETVHYYRMSLAFFLENAERVEKEDDK